MARTRPRGSISSGLDWGLSVLLVLGVGSAAAVLWRDGWKVFLDVLIEDTELFVGIVPKVFAGTLIGALIRILVPRPLIARLIGEGSGLLGLVVAMLAGIVFPGGPFTIFPLAVAFMVAGADRGAAMTFVTAWLLLGLNRAIIWEMPFFGPELVGLRSLVSLPIPLIVGWVARLLPLAPFGGVEAKR
jgi:uncharacterized membrane protein YraQ (UPF0718 family)